MALVEADILGPPAAPGKWEGVSLRAPELMISGIVAAEIGIEDLVHIEKAGNGGLGTVA